MSHSERYGDFSPVLIPTLNRYQHFRACIESLLRNSGCKDTVLIIGLDYPPSDKYLEGYDLIKKYITQLDGFKRIELLEATINLGSYGNYSRLKQFARESGYQSFIFSEDDNVFSPNFLEYMNWGLRSFAEDPSVISICGYKRVNVHFLRNNVYKHIGHSAWGFGSWFDKWSNVELLMNTNSVVEIIKKKPLSVVFSSEVKGCHSLMKMLKNNTYYEDTFPSHLPRGTNYSIFPCESKVRNTGHDGTGEHSGKVSAYDYNNQIIDNEDHFSPIIVDNLVDRRVEDIYKKTYRLSIKTHLFYALKFLRYKMTGNLDGIK